MVAEAPVAASMPIELTDSDGVAIPLVFGDQPTAFREFLTSQRLIDRLTPVCLTVRTSVGKTFQARFSRHGRCLLRERSWYRTQEELAGRTPSG